MEFRKFVFGETLAEAISAIPEEHQLRYFWHITDYGIHGIEPELSGFELSTWVQMKQMIDNTMPKKNKSPIGKNGAPFRNTNAKKQYKTTSNNSKQQDSCFELNATETTANNSNNYPNININVNENINDKFTPPENETHPDQQAFPTADAVDPVESPHFVPQKAEPQSDDTRSDLEPPPHPADSDPGIHAPAAPPQTGAIVPKATSPPSKKPKKQELSPEQMTLFHAAKACFETSEKAKALIYQDKASTAREMLTIKTLVVRCQNMAPELSADFLRNVLEHFRAMTNGKLKGKAVFTPRALITPWIWELVIDSLPENDVHPDLREIIRSLFT